MKHSITHIIDWFQNNILVWLMPSVFAALTKIAYELRKKKTVNTAYIITTIIVASFVGYYVNELCIINKVQQWAGVIISSSALASDSIIKIMMEKKYIVNLISRITGVNIESKEINNDNNTKL